MTTDIPQNKKPRLTWDQPADTVPTDITEKGETIFAPVPTLAERLSTNVLRLWQERSFADLDDAELCSKSAGTSTSSNMQTRPVSSASRPSSPEKSIDAISKTKTDEAIPQKKPPGQIIHEMKTTIFNSVRNAQGEIGVALDVVNILLASTRPDVPSQYPLMLPATGLATTYINRPRASVKVQLEAVRLNLAAKKKQLRAAADILAAGATVLRDVLEKEHRFCEEALAIRNRNWSIQARPLPGKAAAFFVNYGFSDAGSMFREQGIAQVTRDKHARRSQTETGGNDADAATIRLTLSHHIPREVRLKIIEYPAATAGTTQSIRATETCSKSLHEKGENWLWWDLYETNGVSALCTDQSKVSSVARLERDLLAAQSTLFESELYSEIVGEARQQMGRIRLVENHIRLEIDESRDLVLEWAPAQENASPANTNARVSLSDNVSTLLVVKLAMQLMLRRRHRQAADLKKVAIHPELRKKNMTTSPFINNLLNPLRYRRRCEKVMHAVDRITRPLSDRGLRVFVHLIPSANAKEMIEHTENWESAGHVLIVKIDGWHICKLNLRPPFTMEIETANVTLPLLDMEDLGRLLTREILGHCLRRICKEANVLCARSRRFHSDSHCFTDANSSDGVSTGTGLGPSGEWEVCEEGNKISSWIRVLRDGRSICRPIEVTAETTHGSTSCPVYRINFHAPASIDDESVTAFSQCLELREYRCWDIDDKKSNATHVDDVRNVLVSLLVNG